VAFSLERNPAGDWRLTLAGRVTIQDVSGLKKVGDEILRSPDTLAIETERLTETDLALLQLLLALHQSLQSQGETCRFLEPVAPPLRDLITLTGLEKVFPVLSS